MLAFLIFVTATLIMMPGLKGECSGQPMIPGPHVRGQLVHSMGIMSKIMGDMQEITKEGRMTPEQQQEMNDMMNQMSYMMRQMTTPQPFEIGEQQHRRLLKMQNRLKAMKKQVQKQ